MISCYGEISSNFSPLRDDQRDGFLPKITQFILAPMFSDQTEGLWIGGVISKKRKKKKMTVLMVVGDAATQSLCSLSLVLVYRRLNLLSTNCLLVIRF